MKKALLVCLAVLMVVCMFAGCAPKADAPAQDAPAADKPAQDAPSEDKPAEEAKTITIGVDYSTSDKYNLQIFDYVAEKCEEKGWICFGAEGQRDSEKTLSNVDSFITKEADYIYIVGVDINLQKSIQEKCDAAGVTVVFTAGTTEPGYIITTESGGNYENATFVSTYLAEEVKKQWNGTVDLAVVTTNLGMGQDGQDIIKACSEVWSAELGVNPDDIYVVDCGWDSMKASELFTSMFTANPDAKNIVAYSFVDLHHGVPLYNAAKAAGKLENLIMGGTNPADDSTGTCMKESPNTWVAQMPLSGTDNGIVFMKAVIDEVENGVPMEKKVYKPSGDPVICNAEEIQAYY